MAFACLALTLQANNPAHADEKELVCEDLWPNKKIQCLREEVTKHQERVHVLQSRTRSLEKEVNSLSATVSELYAVVTSLKFQVAGKANKSDLANTISKADLAMKADKAELANKADKSDLASVVAKDDVAFVGQQIIIKAGSGECLVFNEKTVSLGSCESGESKFVLEQ